METILIADDPVTRERVEQIRAQMMMRLPDGRSMIIRTHKNAKAYDLLAFIDEHLPEIQR